MIIPGERGKCPHCLVVNKFESTQIDTHSRQWFGYQIDRILEDISLENSFNGEYITLIVSRCAECGKNVIFLNNEMIYPAGSSRPPCPSEVPADISQDYIEACLVEPYSKKAAAALARRCLQSMLRDKGVKPGDLSKEIDEAMQTLPSYLAESIDAIRHIGNFAAHPNKSTSTGQIVDVEIGEAEWALDVLEDLFDFYYVQPAITQRKKDAMNEKLKDLGKPPLKKPN
ncbi:hypothetical protein MSBRW_3167 [Methanosarcina barkeri str. Wiesmoor]|uniref:DUF4145 domain-containing protein n=2 Tax=Methanosarcina barkeri TaxID=2208 RepID=A0A0E3QMU9_METBA|nr:DUF4145 domain-containing protein [Methanosarcina barkeri]AKB52420.1 hypothetical protein MSBRW_3167 [Methanosarcina barkeri str. Wiesmoor]